MKNFFRRSIQRRVMGNGNEDDDVPRRRSSTGSRSSLVVPSDGNEPPRREDESVTRGRHALGRQVFGTEVRQLEPAPHGDVTQVEIQDPANTLSPEDRGAFHDELNQLSGGDGEWNVYLCHARAAAAHCQRLRAQLEVKKVTVVMPVLIQSQDNTASRNAMEHKVENSDTFLLFVTKNLFKREHCLAQIRYALNYDKPIVVMYETDPDHDGIIREEDAKALVPNEFRVLTNLEWVRFKSREGDLEDSIQAMMSKIQEALPDDFEGKKQYFDPTHPILYLSHLSSNGQLQCSLIASELKEHYGINCWIDANNVELTLDIVREALTAAPAYLLFLTRGVLDSTWVQFELDLAIDLGKNIILCHETLPEHGGCQIRELVEQSKGTKYHDLFSKYDSIPYYHRRRFREVTYEFIVEALNAGFDETYLGTNKIWMKQEDIRPPTAVEEKPDIFLSHLSKNGSNQCGLIATELATLFGVQCWWDQNLTTLVKETILEGVRSSTAYLLFLTDGVLDSSWVQLELREAMAHRKLIILVHETEVSNGGGVLDKIKAESRGTDFEPLFINSDSIPFYHLHRFRMATYDTIVQRMNNSGRFSSKFVRRDTTFMNLNEGETGE